MLVHLKNLALLAATFALFAVSALAQTSKVEGVVKGPDGKPLQGAVVKFDRTDIKGHYEVKSDKKGHYGHYGLPLGTYNISVEVAGKVADTIKGVRTTLGDPLEQDFNLKETAEQQKALSEAAASGTLTKEQQRSLSKEQIEAFEKQNKEREAALAKNKALSDAYNAGKLALDNKQYDEAIASLTKASELDATQPAIYSQLAMAYEGAATAKPTEATALRQKSVDAWKKAVELKADEPSFHNNLALEYGRAKQMDEAKAEIEKAATLDPTNAGKYYFNMGAMLMNGGQTEPACQAFKKAIDSQADYADAHYQYGICLIGQAKVAKDGKFDAPPGTAESFGKYLELKPDGPNAESAKSMLASISGSVATKYTNPDAKETKKPAPKKK